MIIGLSGKAQAGKDTVAAILVEDYGFTRLAFADVIKAAVYTLDPIVSLSGLRLQHLVDTNGWEAAKQFPEVRRLLQIFGSEVGRDLIDEQIWIELTMNGIKASGNFVISDVRFRNEAEEIKYQGGQVWRITRAINNPVNFHRSETELDSWNFDQYIPNNATIEDLRNEIKEVMWTNQR